MSIEKFLKQENLEIVQLTSQLDELEALLNQSKGDLALLLGSSLPPPVGTAADVASLGVSVSRGDWGGAFLDVIGLVPLVGDGVKGLVKGTKIANKIENITKAIAHGKKKLADRTKNARKKATEKCNKIGGNRNKKKQDKDAANDCGTVGCGGNKPKPKYKPRKPRQPNRKKWKEKGGKVKDNPDGSTTYTNKDGVSVTYNDKGFPDFSPHSPESPVKIDDMKGDHYHDYKAANKASGRSDLGAEPPEGYTWHHMEDGERMQLVSDDVHGEFSHTGGASAVKNRNK